MQHATFDNLFALVFAGAVKVHHNFIGLTNLYSILHSYYDIITIAEQHCRVHDAHDGCNRQYNYVEQHDD